MNRQLWGVNIPECITVEPKGDIAIIGLNRPKKRNALSDELVLGLHTILSNVPDDISAIVLHGHGDHFCAGLDLNEIKEPKGVEFNTSRIGQQLNTTIQNCRVPIVSVLKGAVIGGGLEIAAASHVRVSETTAFFALPEGSRGIFLGSGGSVRLPKLIGLQTVMDMMLLGRVYKADEAYNRLLLTQYLVEPGEGLPKAIELAERIGKNSGMTNFAVTQALPRIYDGNSESGLFTEMLMASIAANDDDAKKRLREFLELKMNKVRS